MISWPGKIKPDVTTETSHSVDLLPTIAALAGIGRDEFQTDGIDLEPLLFDGQSLPDRTLFWRASSQAAVRRGPWKLYRNDRIIELYNLDDDLGEQHNQADQNPELVRDLSAAWTAWDADVNRSAEKYEP